MPSYKPYQYGRPAPCLWSIKLGRDVGLRLNSNTKCFQGFVDFLNPFAEIGQGPLLVLGNQLPFKTLVLDLDLLSLCPPTGGSFAGEILLPSLVTLRIPNNMCIPWVGSLRKTNGSSPHIVREL